MGLTISCQMGTSRSVSVLQPRFLTKLEIIKEDCKRPFRTKPARAVGNESHHLGVRGDRNSELVRRFACFTADLHQMLEWLCSWGVKPISMQSTGVYRIPLYGSFVDTWITRHYL